MMAPITIFEYDYSKELRNEMKKAKVFVVSIDVYCPYCDECIEEPNSGSLNWDISMISAGDIVKCTNCDKEFEIPALKNVKV